MKMVKAFQLIVVLARNIMSRECTTISRIHVFQRGQISAPCVLEGIQCIQPAARWLISIDGEWCHFWGSETMQVSVAR